jgi:hypothetical protein
MGLDWVIYTENPYLPTREQLETGDDFSHPWQFSAKQLSQLTTDRMWPHEEIHSNMTPPDMRSLADSLEHCQTELQLSDQETVSDACDWLRYWADLGFSVVTY